MLQLHNGWDLSFLLYFRAFALKLFAWDMKFIPCNTLHATELLKPDSQKHKYT